VSTRGVKGDTGQHGPAEAHHGGLATAGWFSGGNNNGGVPAPIAAPVIAVGDGRPLQHQGG
jgi:hypothetical protein